VSGREIIVESQPQKEKPGLQRREMTPDSRKQAAEKPSPVDARDRGKAYIPKPEFAEDNKKTVPRRSWTRWVILTATVAVLGFGAFEVPQWLQSHSQSEFVLTAADIDQAATAKAREMLRAGQVPPELARYPKKLLQRIAEGQESLYTKRLLPPEATETRVHVTISQNGAVIGEDVLTPEHPTSQSFPAGKDTPTQFHFTVEQPGPSQQITCWIKSENSGVIHTKAMGQGESDDLQARAQ
jgi:hypothetical protein